MYIHMQGNGQRDARGEKRLGTRREGKEELGENKREMPLFIEGLTPSVMNVPGYQQQSADRGAKKEG